MNRFRGIPEAIQATVVLILINCIVFMVTVVKGGTVDVLIQYGGLYQPFITYKYEFWRLFTAMFLHADGMHLIMNMFSLYMAGKILEPALGRNRFLAIYFASGLLGNLFGYGLSGATSVSVGASSAVFGLFAAVVLLGRLFPYHSGIRYLSQQFLTIIAVNLIYSFLPGINMWAHIGGLIGGGIVTYCFGGSRVSRANRYTAIAVYIILAVGMFYLGFN